MAILKVATPQVGDPPMRSSGLRVLHLNYGISRQMTIHWSLCFLLSMPLLLSFHRCFSQPKDTLYFYNESKVVGELLTIRLGRVEFDADGIGIVKVKNNKLQSINATSHSFRIETVDGNEIQGYLTRS